MTWFHVVQEDKKNRHITGAQEYLSYIHTSCMRTRQDLIDLGVKPEKIVVIPLGVDLQAFHPSTKAQKAVLRTQLGIPEERIVIGSFQKDGNGWGKGLTPKLIKGPDVFVDVVGELSRSYPVFVLLVGPARGFVERELQKRQVPYKSIGYLANPENVAKYYHALDLYIIASRLEGGPKQILEAWASGVPLISTRVGMVPDIGHDGKDVLMADVEDVDRIVQQAKGLIENQVMQKNLIDNGLYNVQNYTWNRIAQRYYNEIYSKLEK